MESVMTVISYDNISFLMGYAVSSQFWQFGVKPHTNDILRDLQGLTQTPKNLISRHYVCILLWNTGCCKCNSSINRSKFLKVYKLPSSLMLIITWPNFRTNVLNNLMEEGGKSYLLDLTVLGALSPSNWACTPFYNSFLSARGFSYLL